MKLLFIFFKAEDGTVRLDETKCVGCRQCLDACPYHAVYFNEQEQVVGKCTLCGHLTERGEEPMCVAQCGGEALKFGDLDNPGSEVSHMFAKAGQNVFSLEDRGDHPGMRYILRKAKWQGHTNG